jgi:PAS domain S-box-containing protein
MIFEPPPTTETGNGNLYGVIATIATGIIGIITTWLTLRYKYKKPIDAEEEETLVHKTIENLITKIDDPLLKESLCIFNDHLHLLNETYFALLNLSGAAVWESDKDGLCTRASDELAEIIGIEKVEIFNNGWSESVHPDEKDKVYTAWQSSVKRGTNFNMNFRFVHYRRGVIVKTIAVNSRATCLKNRNGQTEKFVGFLTILPQGESNDV